MATTKKLIGAAAFSLLLAGGGVVGALFGTPALSGAQETTTEEAADERRGPRHGHLDAAAEALGMTVEELRAELEDGTTIADVAVERGVDVDSVVDAMVAAATDGLREHITAIVNGDVPPGGRPHGHGHHAFRLPVDTLADVLGIAEDELREALRSGETIADVAEAECVEVQDVVDVLVAEASAHIDEKLAAGDLTQEEAEAHKARLAERIAALVEGEAPRGPFGGPAGPGRRGPAHP